VGTELVCGTELVMRDRARFYYQSQLASLFPSAAVITAVARDFASEKDLLSIE